MVEKRRGEVREDTEGGRDVKRKEPALEGWRRIKRGRGREK